VTTKALKMTTSQGFRFTVNNIKMSLRQLIHIYDPAHFYDYFDAMTYKVFNTKTAVSIQVFYMLLITDVKRIETLEEEFPLTLYQIYCIILRYTKEFHTKIYINFHDMLENFEDKVSKGDITEQEYIERCDCLKQSKKIIDAIVEYYKDDSNIYFIPCPYDNTSVVISINSLPHKDNFVKYMFNYDMERRRCIALKMKQMEDERKAKQAKDDEALIQAFEKQKTKEKKQSIQDLTKQANKKRAKEQQLRKEYEKSAAEKELEKAKDKKKKQQKKTSKA
jgi:hypothetical protein